MSNAVRLRRTVQIRGSVATKEMFTPSQPLVSFRRLVVQSPILSLHGFSGYGVGSQAFFSPEPITSRNDVDTLFDEVEFGVSFEFFVELSTPSFEEFDIRLTKGPHFCLEIEIVIGSDFSLHATFKILFHFGRYTIWIMHLSQRHGSFVVVPFYQFLDAEGRRNVCERKWKEAG